MFFRININISWVEEYYLFFKKENKRYNQELLANIIKNSYLAGIQNHI